MPLLPSDVLHDPAYRVPAVAPADAGVGWLRGHVARFADGVAHARRRDLATGVLDVLHGAPFVATPTVSLLRALGLPDGAEADVGLAAAAYQPHAPQSAEADAAADRLVAACGGRTEEAAARAGVLVQAHAATQALIARRRAGAGGPPVPVTRRIAPDGTEVEVDLTDAWFGGGPHRCPGEALALRLVDEALATADPLVASGAIEEGPA